MGFWAHPDFTLDRARQAMAWINFQYTPDELMLIERVASGDYKDCALHAIWWWERVPEKPDHPFTLPAGFTQFSFRSYEPVNGEYLVTVAGEPKDYESTLPLGTIVTVRC